MLELLTTCCAIAGVLVVWFKTEALQEYSTLFRVDNFFFVPLFEKTKRKNPMLTYIDYINLNHDCFFVRLISCPFCLAFWLSCFASLFWFSFLELPIYYIGSLLIYGLVSKLYSE